MESFTSLPVHDLVRYLNGTYRLCKLHDAFYPTESFLTLTLEGIWFSCLKQLKEESLIDFETLRSKLELLPSEVSNSYTKEPDFKKFFSGRIQAYAKHCLQKTDPSFNPSADLGLNDRILKIFEKAMSMASLEDGQDFVINQLTRRSNNIPKPVQDSYLQQMKEIKTHEEFLNWVQSCKQTVSDSSSKSASEQIWQNIEKQSFSSIEEARKFLEKELGIELEQEKSLPFEKEFLEKVNHYAKKRFGQVREDLSSCFLSDTACIEKIKKLQKLSSSDFDSLEDLKDLLQCELKTLITKLSKEEYDSYQEMIDQSKSASDLLEGFNAKLSSFLETAKKQLHQKASEVSDSLKFWYTIAQDPSTPLEPHLQNLPLSVQEIYRQELKTTTDLQAYAARYFKEIGSIMVHPVSALKVGSIGQPKILTYSRSKSNHTYETKSSFLKYLTSPKEIEIHFLYQDLLKALPFREPGKVDFVLPNGVMLDLSNNTYKSSEKQISLNPLSSQKLQTIFEHFALTQTPRVIDVKKEPSFREFVLQKPLALFDRILEPNLGDFLSAHFMNLTSEEKKDLFKQLGKLAFLDLILGNGDRLIAFNHGHYALIDKKADPSTFKTVLAPSNLGNLMVSHQDSSFTLHLIDNTIGDGRHSDEVFSDLKDRQDYLKFLEEVLSKEDSNEQIAFHLIHSLSLAVRQIGENDHIDRHIQTLHDLFSEKNIHSMDLSSFVEGIQSMRNDLKEVIIPNWKNASPEHLAKKYSGSLLETMSERLDLLSRDSCLNTHAI
jgi:hypothetical protein